MRGGFEVSERAGFGKHAKIQDSGFRWCRNSVTGSMSKVRRVGATRHHDSTRDHATASPRWLCYDYSDKAVTGARITLEGNMSHAGMGPVFAQAKETEPGQYEAPLELSMGGDWLVLLHLTLSDAQKLERQFEISGGRSG